MQLPKNPDPTCSPSLNESPSKKEGKLVSLCFRMRLRRGLNESPSRKEGKSS